MKEGVSKRKFILLAGIIAAISMPFFNFIFQKKVETWVWYNEPVHSSVEALGAIAAILMAIIMLQRCYASQIKQSFYFPSLGLLTMGIFDLFHSLCSPGQAFVFLHSIAGLFGGLGFILIWSPINLWCKDCMSRRTQLYNLILILLSVFAMFISVWVFMHPDATPAMLHKGKFTDAAININLIGGVLFIISSLYFVRRFILEGNVEDYLFFLLTLLFGIAGLVFNYSQIWDFQWWLWHILRLIAYLLILVLLISTVHKTQKKLQVSSESLRVANEKIKNSTKAMIQTERKNYIGIFSGGIAHELNNPLMGILNYSQYCLSAAEKESKIFKVLQGIEKEAKRCVDVIKSIITFSRLEQEGEEKFIDEHVTTIITRVLHLLEHRINKENANIKTNFPKDELRITMQPSKLQHVFLNIIINALNAVKNAATKEIVITVVKEGNKVVIIISDTGCGIKEKYMDKLFAPFFTIEEAGKAVGLGLASAKEIIEEHNGKMSCESTENVGTTFKIQLPIKQGKKYI